VEIAWKDVEIQQLKDQLYLRDVEIQRLKKIIDSDKNAEIQRLEKTIQSANDAYK
jgi:FAD synthase